MKNKRKVYDMLNAALQAHKSCLEADWVNKEWEDKWDNLITHIEKNYLPNGSGFDCGTHVVRDECVNNRKIVLEFSYHHMDTNGYYDGWSTHKVIVTPMFDGIDIHIKGALPRKYRHSKDYLTHTMYESLIDTISRDEIDTVLEIGEVK